MSEVVLTAQAPPPARSPAATAGEGEGEGDAMEAPLEVNSVKYLASSLASNVDEKIDHDRRRQTYRR